MASGVNSAKRGVEMNDLAAQLAELLLYPSDNSRYLGALVNQR